MTEQKANGFDLASLDTAATAGDGAVMEVRHPATGEVLRFDDGAPFTITLLGRDSEKLVTLARAQQDKRLQMMQRSRTPIAAANIEKDDVEFLVAATKDWNVILDGKKAPSHVNEYRKAYTKFRWLREQVDEYVGNRANFTKG